MSTREILLDGGSPWGFRITGGADTAQPLKVARVNPGSRAAQRGVREGDVISSINNQSAKSITNSDAHALLRTSGETLLLGLNEDNVGSPKRRSHRSSNPQETKTATVGTPPSTFPPAVSNGPGPTSDSTRPGAEGEASTVVTTTAQPTTGATTPSGAEEAQSIGSLSNHQSSFSENQVPNSNRFEMSSSNNGVAITSPNITSSVSGSNKFSSSQARRHRKARANQKKRFKGDTAEDQQGKEGEDEEVEVPRESDVQEVELFEESKDLKPDTNINQEFVVAARGDLQAPETMEKDIKGSNSEKVIGNEKKESKIPQILLQNEIISNENIDGLSSPDKKKRKGSSREAKTAVSESVCKPKAAVITCEDEINVLSENEKQEVEPDTERNKARTDLQRDQIVSAHLVRTDNVVPTKEDLNGNDEVVPQQERRKRKKETKQAATAQESPRDERHRAKSESACQDLKSREEPANSRQGQKKGNEREKQVGHQDSVISEKRRTVSERVYHDIVEVSFDDLNRHEEAKSLIKENKKIKGETDNCPQENQEDMLVSESNSQSSETLSGNVDGRKGTTTASHPERKKRRGRKESDETNLEQMDLDGAGISENQIDVRTALDHDAVKISPVKSDVQNDKITLAQGKKKRKGNKGPNARSEEICQADSGTVEIQTNITEHIHQSSIVMFSKNTSTKIDKVISQQEESNETNTDKTTAFLKGIDLTDKDLNSNIKTVDSSLRIEEEREGSTASKGAIETEFKGELEILEGEIGNCETTHSKNSELSSEDINVNKDKHDGLQHAKKERIQKTETNKNIGEKITLEDNVILENKLDNALLKQNFVADMSEVQNTETGVICKETKLEEKPNRDNGVCCEDVRHNASVVTKESTVFISEIPCSQVPVQTGTSTVVVRGANTELIFLEEEPHSQEGAKTSTQSSEDSLQPVGTDNENSEIDLQEEHESEKWRQFKYSKRTRRKNKAGNVNTESNVKDNDTNNSITFGKTDNNKAAKATDTLLEEEKLSSTTQSCTATYEVGGCSNSVDVDNNGNVVDERNFEIPETITALMEAVEGKEHSKQCIEIEDKVDIVQGFENSGIDNKLKELLTQCDQQVLNSNESFEHLSQVGVMSETSHTPCSSMTDEVDRHKNNIGPGAVESSIVGSTKETNRDETVSAEPSQLHQHNFNQENSSLPGKGAVIVRGEAYNIATTVVIKKVELKVLEESRDKTTINNAQHENESRGKLVSGCAVVGKEVAERDETINITEVKVSSLELETTKCRTSTGQDREALLPTVENSFNGRIETRSITNIPSTEQEKKASPPATESSTNEDSQRILLTSRPSTEQQTEASPSTKERNTIEESLAVPLMSGQKILQQTEVSPSDKESSANELPLAGSHSSEQQLKGSPSTKESSSNEENPPPITSSPFVGQDKKDSPSERESRANANKKRPQNNEDKSDVELSAEDVDLLDPQPLMSVQEEGILRKFLQTLNLNTPEEDCPVYQRQVSEEGASDSYEIIPGGRSQLIPEEFYIPHQRYLEVILEENNDLVDVEKKLTGLCSGDVGKPRLSSRTRSRGKTVRWKQDYIESAGTQGGWEEAVYDPTTGSIHIIYNEPDDCPEDWRDESTLVRDGCVSEAGERDLPRDRELTKVRTWNQAVMIMETDDVEGREENGENSENMQNVELPETSDDEVREEGCVERRMMEKQNGVEIVFINSSDSSSSVTPIPERIEEMEDVENGNKEEKPLATEDQHAETNTGVEPSELNEVSREKIVPFSDYTSSDENMPGALEMLEAAVHKAEELLLKGIESDNESRDGKPQVSGVAQGHCDAGEQMHVDEIEYKAAEIPRVNESTSVKTSDTEKKINLGGLNALDQSYSQSLQETAQATKNKCTASKNTQEISISMTSPLRQTLRSISEELRASLAGEEDAMLDIAYVDESEIKDDGTDVLLKATTTHVTSSTETITECLPPDIEILSIPPIFSRQQSSSSDATSMNTILFNSDHSPISDVEASVAREAEPRSEHTRQTPKSLKLLSISKVISQPRGIHLLQQIGFLSPDFDTKSFNPPVSSSDDSLVYYYRESSSKRQDDSVKPDGDKNSDVVAEECERTRDDVEQKVFSEMPGSNGYHKSNTEVEVQTSTQRVTSHELQCIPSEADTWLGTPTLEPRLLVCLSPSQRRSFHGGDQPTPEDAERLLDLHSKFLQRRSHNENANRRQFQSTNQYDVIVTQPQVPPRVSSKNVDGRFSLPDQSTLRSLQQQENSSANKESDDSSPHGYKDSLVKSFGNATTRNNKKTLQKNENAIASGNNGVASNSNIVHCSNNNDNLDKVDVNKVSSVKINLNPVNFIEMAEHMATEETTTEEGYLFYVDNHEEPRQERELSAVMSSDAKIPHLSHTRATERGSAREGRERDDGNRLLAILLEAGSQSQEKALNEQKHLKARSYSPPSSQTRSMHQTENRYQGSTQYQTFASYKGTADDGTRGRPVTVCLDERGIERETRHVARSPSWLQDGDGQKANLLSEWLKQARQKENTTDGKAKESFVNRLSALLLEPSSDDEDGALKPPTNGKEINIPKDKTREEHMKLRQQIMERRYSLPEQQQTEENAISEVKVVSQVKIPQQQKQHTQEDLAAEFMKLSQDRAQRQLKKQQQQESRSGVGQGEEFCQASQDGTRSIQQQQQQPQQRQQHKQQQQQQQELRGDAVLENELWKASQDRARRIQQQQQQQQHQQQQESRGDAALENEFWLASQERARRIQQQLQQQPPRSEDLAAQFLKTSQDRIRQEQQRLSQQKRLSLPHDQFEKQLREVEELEDQLNKFRAQERQLQHQETQRPPLPHQQQQQQLRQNQQPRKQDEQRQQPAEPKKLGKFEKQRFTFADLQKKYSTREIFDNRQFDANDYKISKQGDIAVIQLEKEIQRLRPVQRPKSTLDPVVLGADHFRQQMYNEYMQQVAERVERRKQKVLKISAIPGKEEGLQGVGSPPETPEKRLSIARLENEFMDRVKERMDKLGMRDDEEDDDGGYERRMEDDLKSCSEVSEDSQALFENWLEDYVIEGDVQMKGLPPHLQEFLALTAGQVDQGGVWYPGATSATLPEPADSTPEASDQTPTSPNSVQQSVSRLEDALAKAKEDAGPVIWTPKSAGASPQLEKKEFRPVNFESPTLTRKTYTSTPKQEECPPPSWQQDSFTSVTSGTPGTPANSVTPINSFGSPTLQSPLSERSVASSQITSSLDKHITQTTERRFESSERRLTSSQSAPASGLFSLASSGIKLPRVQNPTITLLQKAREGQLPRGALYLDQTMSSKEDRERNHTSRSDYESDSDMKRKAETRPKIEGIGPTTKDGMPIVLRSEVRDENHAKWYKKMYDSLHRAGKDDQYVTVRYRPRRGKYPYTSAGGYLSEPDHGGYDSDLNYSAKYATLDRRRIKNKENDYTSSMPRNRYVPHPESIRYATEVYKTQPGRIENYEPGSSSISDKEAKQWWDEVLDIFDGAAAEQEKQQRQQYTPTPTSNKSFMTHALKESGYESDSTLVFKRRDDNQSALSPAEHKIAYKSIQKGGEVPLHGFRKQAPERPKESPHRYVESEVTIHYRSPVRAEAKEAMSEEELARVQAEAMRRIYQENRRRKYLQELQDMNSRRHTDNFTPSQKSPIPLNRYDDFLEEPLATRPRSRDRTPEPKLVARALYNFQGQTSRELSFRRGDIIYVRRQIDKNWYEGEHNAMIGLFPFNYVEIIPYDGIRTIPRKPTEGQARAKFNFIAQTHLELSLVKGELVVLTRRVDDNWYEGRIGARKGIFPVSYVDVFYEPGQKPAEPVVAVTTVKPVASPASHSLLLNGKPASPSPFTPQTSTNKPLHIDTHSDPVPYCALYNYRPQNADELELREGDTVYVMEKCDDGWYVGSSHRTGQFGTFPGNYVQRI